MTCQLMFKSYKVTLLHKKIMNDRSTKILCLLKQKVNLDFKVIKFLRLSAMEYSKSRLQKPIIKFSITKSSLIESLSSMRKAMYIYDCIFSNLTGKTYSFDCLKLKVTQ